MKSRPILAFVAAAAASVSCVHRTQVSKATTPAPAPVSMWDRQVRNAIDAGDGDYSLRALRQKVTAEPDNVAVRLELAKAYSERGYHEVALEIARLAAARFPQSGEAQLSLVSALRDVNRREEAIASLEAFLKLHPASGAACYSWLGILRDESALWPLGEPAHRKALELAPEAPYLHNNLGYNLLMQNKNEEAAAEFREALKRDPASQMARNNLAIALLNSDAAKEALANLQSTYDPATAHNNLAAVWMERGKYPEARRELDLALGYNRAHPAALHNLELVSRMDAGPAALHVKPLDSRWQRLKTGVRKLFVGPLDDSRTEPPQSASAH